MTEHQKQMCIENFDRMFNQVIKNIDENKGAVLKNVLNTIEDFVDKHEPSTLDDFFIQKNFNMFSFLIMSGFLSQFAHYLLEKSEKMEKAIEEHLETDKM